MINKQDIGFGQVIESVDHKKEVRINSVELVDLINDFREIESEMTGSKLIILKHDDFMKKINKELKVLKSIDFSLRNISESEYMNSRGKTYPCYSLNRDGMLQMLNSESTLVRAKTIEYINKLEKELSKPKPLTTREELKLHYRAIEELDVEFSEIKDTVTQMQDNMPLFNVECKELQALVRKVGIRTLGGYKSPAYDDNSIRGKVYADIQSQLKREFGVTRYEAIKRVQLEQAMQIVKNYRSPLILQERIQIANKQMRIIEGRRGNK